MTIENTGDAKMLYMAYAEADDGLIEQIPNVVGVVEGSNWVNMVCDSGETHMLANSTYTRIRMEPMGVSGITQ